MAGPLDNGLAAAKPQGRGGTVLAVIIAVVALLLALQGQNIGLGSYIPLAIFSPTPATSSFVDVVDLNKNVTYHGIQRDGVEHFQNIFYGQDTSGKNRFAPPLPYVPEPGSNVDATAEGAWCPQAKGASIFSFASAVTNISENCLSLRIARPQSTEPTSRLPVVVWLHGGGHALGSTYEKLYAPDGLIKQSVSSGQPTIFVGVNYRVGLFGFATSEALMKAKHTNAGLRDQIAAFEWVKTNIAAFGGDPDRVTAIGHSVGAGDIGLHLLSYGGKKGVPFNRAIMMSGAPGLIFNIQNDHAAERTSFVVDDVGCALDRDAESDEALQCLREAPMELLVDRSVEMMREARPPFGEGYFHPTFDNDLILDHPSELMRRGEFVKNVPIIASWVFNDGAWYAPHTTNTDDETTASFMVWTSHLQKDIVDQLLLLYPPSDFEHLVSTGGQVGKQYLRAAQIIRDLMFTCPVLDFTWQYAKGSGVEYVRLYEFNQTRFGPAFQDMGVPFWRASHLSDVPYVFNTGNLLSGVDSSAEQLLFSSKMSSRIIAFAHQEGVTDAADVALKGWGPAYAGSDEDALKSDFPQSIQLNLLGGPYGSGMVSTLRTGKAEDKRVQAVEWEKLFARCDFINSEKVRKALGV